MTEVCRRCLRAVLPVEWLLIIFGSATWLLYWALGAVFPGGPEDRSKYALLRFYLKGFIGAYDLYVLLLLGYAVLQAVYFWHIKRGRPWRELWGILLARVQLREIFQDVRLFHAILVLLVEFLLLKNLIPRINPRVYDEAFISSDTFLCGGVLCAQQLHTWLGHGFAEAVSAHYHWYYHYLTLVPALFVIAAPRSITQEFIFALAGIFLLGVLWVFLVPTWGPVFVQPELFAFLEATDVRKLQQDLWRWRNELLQDPNKRGSVFLISGFPSLHVAVVALGSVYVARLNRVLGALSLGFLLLMLNSTIYLGWHYLLDDIGAFVLVGVVIWIAQRCSQWWQALHNGAP